MTPEEKRKKIILFFVNQMKLVRAYAVNSRHSDETMFRCAYTLESYYGIPTDIAQISNLTARIALEQVVRGLRNYEGSHLDSPEAIETFNLIFIPDLQQTVEQCIEYVQNLINDLMSLIVFSDIPTEV